MNSVSKVPEPRFIIKHKSLASANLRLHNNVPSLSFPFRLVTALLDDTATTSGLLNLEILFKLHQ